MSRRTFLLVAASLAAAGFLGALVGVDDPDTFHHLALGREIAARGLFTQEPFLYPLRGAPTMPAPYWLGSLAIWGWVALLGERALAALPALAAAALAVLLLLDAAPRNGRHTLATAAASLLPVALALETFRYRAVARPELFALLLLGATMWAIRRFEDGRPRLLLAFPLAALVWANLHPSTLAGIVPVVVLVLAALASRAAARLLGRDAAAGLTARQIGLAVGVAAAGLAASFANPSPSNPVLGAARFALAALRVGAPGSRAPDQALEGVTQLVAEMQGAGALVWRGPVGVLIVVTALSFLLRRRAPRAREVVTVALFAALPFGAVRFATMFAVVAAPIAARNLGEALAAVPERVGKVRARLALALAAALLAMATLPLGGLAPHLRLGTGLVRGAFPVRGADYLQAIGFQGRLFNAFQLGGYLEWRGVGPPFQDGRGLLPPGEAQAAMLGVGNRAAFAMLDARYRFDAVLLDVPVLGPDFARGLAASGRTDDFVLDRRLWSLVAFDDGGLLYLRRDGRHAGLAARDEYRHAVPASPSALPAGDVGVALEEYQRSVAEAPGCVRCRRGAAELALAADRAGDAVALSAPAVEDAFGPERVKVLTVAARALDALGRRDEARGVRERLLALDEAERREVALDLTTRAAAAGRTGNIGAAAQLQQAAETAQRSTR